MTWCNDEILPLRRREKNADGAPYCLSIYMPGWCKHKDLSSNPKRNSGQQRTGWKNHTFSVEPAHVCCLCQLRHSLQKSTFITIYLDQTRRTSRWNRELIQILIPTHHVSPECVCVYSCTCCIVSTKIFILPAKWWHVCWSSQVQRLSPGSGWF